MIYIAKPRIAHINFVTDFHIKLYESDYVYEKSHLRPFASIVTRALTDRLVKVYVPNVKIRQERINVMIVALF